MRYETAEISLVGHREQNQDRVAVVRNESTAFLIVVDGMGGHAQGERAAVVARESFIRSFDEASGDVADPQLFISEAISNVVSALVMGGILAFLILFLFLRDSRYPFAIATAIPVSVVGTFALMEASTFR